MRNVSNKSFREHQNTHFMFSNLCDYVEKCFCAREATEDNMANVCCMLDT